MKDYTNKYILDSLNLPIIEDLFDFAQQISISEKLLYFLSNEKNLRRYNTFTIPKKNGKYRKISEPVYSLKIIQRWILENLLYKMKVTSNCYGFKKSSFGSPLVSNAEQHKNNLFILKMDLEDFFPSISRERVFYQFKMIGYNNYIANILTNICTYDGCLPQGAVTSPYLANLICYKMDNRIEKYCSKREIVYTRYADDLTFSCNNRNLLRNIYGMISKIVGDEGFTVNKNKTTFMTPKSHKCITGVTINDKLIKAPKQLKKMIRAMLHRAIITGDYSNINKVRGYISYIDSIEEGYKEKIINYINNFKDDTITLFPDAVEAFNANKIFKQINNLDHSHIRDFIKDESDHLYYMMVEEQRNTFLNNHGYIEKDIEIPKSESDEDASCPF